MQFNNQYLLYFYNGFAVFLFTSTLITDKCNPQRCGALRNIGNQMQSRICENYVRLLLDAGPSESKTMFGQDSVVSICVKSQNRSNRTNVFAANGFSIKHIHNYACWLFQLSKIAVWTHSQFVQSGT